MDQQSEEPLKRVISDIITMVAFIQSGKLNWKIILPLRPETWLRITYNVLAGRAGGTNYTRTPLNAVYNKMATEIRGNKLAEAIKQSHQIVPVFHNIGKELIYAPISSPVAAKFYNSVMQWLPNFAQDSEETLNKYCNGSLRDELEIRNRLLRSVVAGRAIKKLLCGEGNPEELKLENETYSYECLTGIISNPTPGCCDNFIPNLYYFIRNGEGSDLPEHTWICPYILCYLMKNRALAVSGIPYAKMMNVFDKLGFLEVTLKSALYYLKSYRGMVLHLEATDKIYFTPRIIEGLLELFVHPAYTDVMATETPVEKRYIDQGMDHTSAINCSDFPVRSQTSLLFLQQLIEDERTIVAKLKMLDPDDDFTKIKFFDDIKRQFNKPQLDGLSSAIFLKYRDRFSGKDGKGGVREDHKNWRKTRPGYNDWLNQMIHPQLFLNEIEKNLYIEPTKY